MRENWMLFCMAMRSRCIILNRQKKLLLLIVCTFWFAQYVYIPYQVTYLQSLGYGSAQTGMVVGAYGLVQIFCRIPFGMLADHVGKHKKIIVSGLIAVATASVFRIAMPNLTGYFIANLFSGLGASAWISYMVLYLSYFDNSKLQSATGKVLAANNSGVFLGFLVSSLSYAVLGMKFICAMSVTMGIAGLFLCIGIRENSHERETLSYRELLKTATYKRLLFFSFLALLQQGIQMATVMSFTVKIIKKLGAQGWQIGMTSIIYIVFAVLFATLSTKSFFAKIGYRCLVPAGIVVQFLYCVLVPNMTSIYGVYACQILASAAMGFLFTALTSESMKGIPENRNSTAMGIFQAVYAVGMTLLPVLTGAIADTYQLRTAYYVMAALLATGFVSAVVFYRKEKSYGC